MLFCCCPRRRFDVTPLPNAGSIFYLSHYQGDWGLNETGQWNVPPVFLHFVYAIVVCVPHCAREEAIIWKQSRASFRLCVSICGQGIDLNLTTRSPAATALCI